MAGTFAFPTFSAVSDPVAPANGAAFQGMYRAISAPNLNVFQRKAIAIVALIDLAKNLGDLHDYSSTHAQLIDDAEAFAGILTNYDLDIGLIVLFWLMAKAQNAGLQTNITTLIGTGRDFTALPEMQLNEIISLLLYRSFV